ncbi:MAG: TolC family outer membrane protein [Pseudomonadota bacterium]
MSIVRRTLLLTAMMAATAVLPATASAETILGAMAKAYENNPDLNAARAGLRATDEGVAIAKSGYRPFISGSASLSATSTQRGGPLTPSRSNDASVGVTFTQSLFDGFQTRNNVRAAEANVFGGQQDLINTEMIILLSAAQIYANVVRDAQIVQVRRQNLEFLREQRNAAQARFDVGEGTRTDIALAQAQLESARAALLSAQAQFKSSEAVYVQIVGQAPKNLQTPQPIRKDTPSTLDRAVQAGLREHPNILGAQYSVDAAAFGVKALEGSLLPSVSLNGSVNYSDGGTTASSVSANVSVPIYQAGEASARVRQAKESLGQARILVDSARREVEQDIVTDWAQLEASNASIAANVAQVEAAQLALRGVVEERRVGQATQLDVLETQSNVLDAQESLAQSQRDAVVASYSLLSSMGRLRVPRLGLRVAQYRPVRHYEAVKDKWFGLRTVDGR